MTAITEVIVRGPNLSGEGIGRVIVVPEERENLLYRKSQQPLLKENVTKSGWRFMFYDDARALAAEARRKRTLRAADVEELLKMPRKPRSSRQTKFFEKLGGRSDSATQ